MRQAAPALTRTISLSDPPIGGDDVRVVQERLAWLGYATPAHRRFGPDTAAALCRFQLVNGLFADGVIKWTTYSNPTGQRGVAYVVYTYRQQSMQRVIKLSCCT